MAASAQYPIELRPPDLAAYREGNTGIPYVSRFDSGKPGPNVLVTALVHGNELCGAIALDWLLRQRLRPVAGALNLAFCNVAAYERFDPAAPAESRFVDEDFNRVWSPEKLGGRHDSVELARARELRPIVEAADFLLDLHSMQHATPPLIIAGPLEKGRRFARELGFPALIVSDEGHAAGRRMRDHAGFGDPASPKQAVLVECGQHWEAASAAVAREALVRFLALVKAVDPAWAKKHMPAKKPAPQKLVEVTHAVTVRTDAFRFVQDYRGLEIVAKAGTVIADDGGIKVTTPYDNCVLIMPSLRLWRGQTAIRLGRYVGEPAKAR
jgi:predicted deacylase